MQTFKCNLCEKEYDNYTSISLHYRKSHEIPSSVVRKLIYNNGEDPLCKCGCGEEVSWNYKEEKFNDFKQGHYVRTTGGFYSPNGAKKSGETRRERYASGERIHHHTGKKLEEIVGEERAFKIKNNLRTNTTRKLKISASLSGKSKSPEHREQMKKQLAINRKDRLTSGKMSKPERLMQNLLESHGIEYTYQHEVSGFFYDFYIPSKNILIEVDGDFWHCKPGTKHETPIMPEQIKNVTNDKKKTAIAYSNSYTLLRFWESDIQDNRLQVSKTLIENLI